MTDDLTERAREALEKHYPCRSEVRLALQYLTPDLARRVVSDAERIAELEAAVVKARKEGMLRAAEIAQKRWRAWGRSDPHGPVECDVTACENIADAIRAEAEKEAE